MVVSEFRTSAEGKRYLTVDGKPFLYNSVESYIGEKNKLSRVFSCCANAGYSVLSIWLSWRDVEMSEGKYDFGFLEKIINMAKEYNQRIEIVWGGTNFCDKLDVRLVPDWILQNKLFLLHDKAHKPVYVSGNDMGMCNVANLRSRKLLSVERAALLSVVDYLKTNDPTHRVVLIRLANDINMNGYASGKEDTLRYINSLAKSLGAADYKIAVTLTISNWYQEEFDKDIDNLKHIEAQGISTFVPNVSFTKKVITDPNATKFKYISANGAYENSTSHIVTALCNGGFYCIYRLTDDIVWDRPGLYDENYNTNPITIKIRNFNLSAKKIEALISVAAKENTIGFNIESDGMPDMFFCGFKTIKNFKIGYITRCNSSVGMCVYSGNYFYCITDSMGTFFFEKQMNCEVGYLDKDNKWIATQKRDAMIYNARFYYNCNSRECLRMRCIDIDI